MCGSNQILSNEKWGVFYIRVPALKVHEGWEVVEVHGVKRVKFTDGEYYVPKNGVACMKIRKKVDLVVFKEGRYFIKTGEDYTTRVIMFGEFGVRMINADPEVDGIETPSPDKIQKPEVPAEIKWVVVENAYDDPEYMNIITEKFTIDYDDKKIIISPDELSIL